MRVSRGSVGMQYVEGLKALTLLVRSDQKTNKYYGNIFSETSDGYLGHSVDLSHTYYANYFNHIYQYSSELPESYIKPITSSLHGKLNGIVAGFGAEVGSDAWNNANAEVVIAEPILADVSLTNDNDVSGKIVLIDRGAVEFSLKAKNAQDAGAVGVIIINTEDALQGMTAGTYGNDITIPVVGVTSSTGAMLKSAVSSGAYTIEFNQSLEYVPEDHMAFQESFSASLEQIREIDINDKDILEVYSTDNYDSDGNLITSGTPAFAHLKDIDTFSFTDFTTNLQVDIQILDNGNPVDITIGGIHMTYRENNGTIIAEVKVYDTNGSLVAKGISVSTKTIIEIRLP
jgi:hypothetical protein